MTVSACVQNTLGFHVAHGEQSGEMDEVVMGLELLSKRQLVSPRGATGAHSGNRVTVSPGNVRQTVPSF